MRADASETELSGAVARHFEAMPVDEEAILGRFFEHLDGVDGGEPYGDDVDGESSLAGAAGRVVAPDVAELELNDVFGTFERFGPGDRTSSFASSRYDSRGELAGRSRLHIVCYHLPVRVWKDDEGQWRAGWGDSLIARSPGEGQSVADAVETSPDAPLVITSADPKAFSAGGDVTAIAGGPPRDVVDFLHLEYATLDALRERRNTIAVSDGIVMGAGAGVFMACATRVVTERARFAMPEVKIALVPDAGALRFLSKHCEPAVARFLAVTGYNLNAHDLVACGLATHFVAAKRDQLAPLLEELAAAFHRWYDSCRVTPQGDDAVEPVHGTRLVLSDATGQVLRNGLTLLGVSAPERM